MGPGFATHQPQQPLRAQLLFSIAIAATQLLTPGAQANSGGVPALYPTKAEAEAAAKKHFNCTGAHPMGKQWMPCATHGQSNGNVQHNH
jgi:hypothetical protein